jgi:hypothetical protein
MGATPVCASDNTCVLCTTGAVGDATACASASTGRACVRPDAMAPAFCGCAVDADCVADRACDTATNRCAPRPQPDASADAATDATADVAVDVASDVTVKDAATTDVTMSIDAGADAAQPRVR